MYRFESELLKRILAYLKKSKIFHWRNNTGVARFDDRWIKFGKVGSGDIIGAFPNGIMFIIETKKDVKGKLGDDQIEFAKEGIKNNCKYCKVWSFKMFKAWFDAELEEVYSEGLYNE